ncbi:MAG: multiheme C-type cytochrome [Thermodesulfobacteriota bacterium]
MRQQIIFTTLFIVAVALTSCTGKEVGDGPDASAAAGGHPPLSEQEKLIACADCHRDATPEIHQQWYDSRHGIGMVKCYQCHGTFENLAVVPEKSKCATCHMAAMDKCPKDKECSSCHSAHSFTNK